MENIHVQRGDKVVSKIFSKMTINNRVMKMSFDSRLVTICRQSASEKNNINTNMLQPFGNRKEPKTHEIKIKIFFYRKSNFYNKSRFLIPFFSNEPPPTVCFAFLLVTWRHINDKRRECTSSCDKVREV